MEIEEKKVDETVESTEVEKAVQEEKKEKTFTQTEVDAIVKSRIARTSKKAEVKEQKVDVQEGPEEPKEDLEKTILMQENLALKANVDSNEVDYVVYKVSRMDGVFEENLEKFISENPRFTKTDKEQKENKGFVIGSDGEESSVSGSEISNIFGNK